MQQASPAQGEDASALGIEPTRSVRQPRHPAIRTGSVLGAENLAGPAGRNQQLVDVGVRGAVVRGHELAHHGESQPGVGVLFVRLGEVVLLVQVVLFNIREQENRLVRPALGAAAGAVGHAAGWEAAVGIVVVVQCDSQLAQVVLALRAARRLARLLHGRQQQGDQDRDDRDHDQQLDQGEAVTTTSMKTWATVHDATPKQAKQEQQMRTLDDRDVTT